MAFIIGIFPNLLFAVTDFWGYLPKPKPLSHNSRVSTITYMVGLYTQLLAYSVHMRRLSHHLEFRGAPYHDDKGPT